jgi:hypothetical protein
MMWRLAVWCRSSGLVVTAGFSAVMKADGKGTCCLFSYHMSDGV